MKQLIFAGFLFSFSGLVAQEGQFVNPNQSLLTVNPSFAGSNGGIRNQLSYRSEATASKFKSDLVSNSLDCYFKKIQAGFGMTSTFSSMYGGTFTKGNVSFTYAQYLKLKESGWYFIPSVQLGYQRKAIRSDWYVPDPNSSPINPVKEYVDGSAGFLMKYKNDFYGGFYFSHINRPDVGYKQEHKLPMGVTFNSSYSFHFGQKTLLQLMGVYSRQDYFNLFRFNATLVVNRFISGLCMTANQGPGFLLGYRGNMFTISAGSDWWYTKLGGISIQNFETHLSFNLRDKDHRRVFTNIETW